MPRRQVPFISSHYYHFYNRGNNRQAVFFEDDNYLYFLCGMKRCLMPVLSIIAYCLMPTHYHLLVRVKDIDGASAVQTSEVFETSEVSAQVSRAMQKLLISYTKAINKRFERVGALFQGTFRAKAVTSEAYLLHLCRYIHANPVKDGLVADPADWPYSNYLEWIEERQGMLVDRAFIRELLPDAENPTGAYRALVADYLRTRFLPEEVRTFLHEIAD
ncbi:MAG: transposase [Chloroflexota bacterium]|jgi:REP element-mobilizing transposase RayT